MNRIKEISVEMSDDETVSFDIFSQLEGAYPLVITMGEDDKGKKTYSLSAGIPKKDKLGMSSLKKLLFLMKIWSIS